MIVNCEKCDTSFKLDEAKIPPEGAWVRCSKCQEVFQVFVPGAQPAPRAEEEILELDRRPPKPKGVDHGGDFGLEIDESEAPETTAAKSRGKGFKVFFWLLATLILLAVVAAGSLVALDRLGLASSLVDRFRGLPGLGVLLTGKAAVTATSVKTNDATGLALTQVRGYFRVNQQAGRVFVIQGLVENRQQQVRAGVLVRGKLNDEQGTTVRQAVVYAGPIFNPDELRQLSLQDIQARLGQPVGSDGSRFTVGPGGTIPFMIVFANLPDNLSNFTAEVVGSEPLPAPGPQGQ